jgi:hypothetical protein
MPKSGDHIGIGDERGPFQFELSVRPPTIKIVESAAQVLPYLTAHGSSVQKYPKGDTRLIVAKQASSRYITYDDPSDSHPIRKLSVRHSYPPRVPDRSYRQGALERVTHFFPSRE